MKNKGFTMIETLVAIAILMISIAGPLTIAHKGLMAAIYARDQIQASYLAQDAMEYLKNVRDYNLIANATDSSVDWLRYLYGPTLCTSASNSCTVNTDGIPASSNPGISSGSGSFPFKTNFYIIPNGSDEASLVVNVTWTTGTITNTVTLENELFKVLR